MTQSTKTVKSFQDLGNLLGLPPKKTPVLAREHKFKKEWYSPKSTPNQTEKSNVQRNNGTEVRAKAQVSRNQVERVGTDIAEHTSS